VIDPATGTIIVQQTIPVAAEGEYSFSYGAHPPVYDSSCTITHQTITQINPLTLSSEEFENHFCYNCVYDLTISLKDDCHNEMIKTLKAGGSPEGNTAIVGNQSNNCEVSQINFSSDGFFNIENPTTTDPVNLAPGSYTLTKSLNLNTDVLNQYANDYLARTDNCLLTLEDFYSQSLGEADFSGCNITCTECLAQLGPVSTYTAPGCTNCLTVEQYDALVEQCNALCSYKSIKCESAYQSMLADVSPGGQYCQYTTGGGTNSNGIPVAQGSTYTPWTFPLSLLREWNELPRRSVYVGIFGTGSSTNAFQYTSGTGSIWYPSWRNPYNSTATGAAQFAYLDEDGNVDMIALQDLGGGFYNPSVDLDNLSKIVINADGSKSVEPRYLRYSEDFKNRWKPSWAQSLVYIHPEYCLYERCLADEASNNYDSEMSLPATLTDVHNIPHYSGDPATELFNPVANMPGSSVTIVADPYFAPGTPLGNGNYMLADIQQAMIDYMKIPGTFPVQYYTIWEAVWVMQHCPTIGSSLMNCGACVLPSGTMSLSTQADWDIFQPLYMSLKQSFQDRENMKYAIDNGCYNGCIGKTNFNPFDYGFYVHEVTPAPNPWSSIWAYTAWIWGTTNTSEYYNTEQPCNRWDRDLYKQKKPRFPTTSHLLSMASSGNTTYQTCYDDAGNPIECPPIDDAAIAAMQNEAELTNYQACKQCPKATRFEALLKGLTQIDSDPVGTPAAKDLMETSGPVLLTCYPTSLHSEFIPDLHHDFLFGATEIVNWNYDATVTTYTVGGNPRSYLRGTIDGASSSPKILRLIFPYKIVDQIGALPSQVNAAPFVHPYTFSDVTDICCLTYQPSSVMGGGPGNFKCLATVLVKAPDPLYNAQFNQYRNIELVGDITGLNLGDCTFEPVCNTSAVGNGFQDLLNALLFKEPGMSPPPVDFFQTGVSLNNLPYSDFLSNNENLVTQLGGVTTPSLTSFTWDQVSATGTTYIGTITGGTYTCTLTMATTSTSPTVAVTDIRKLFNVKPVSGGAPGDFEALALVGVSPTKYEKVTGNMPCLDMGSCSTEINILGTAFGGSTTVDLMCPELPKAGPGFPGFLKDATGTDLEDLMTSLTYTFTAGHYVIVTPGPNACTMDITFPPNPFGFTSTTQIADIVEFYADPAYLVPGGVTTHFIMDVIMDDGTHMSVNGNAPCEEFLGCGSHTECTPVEVIINGDFSLGFEEFTSTYSSVVVGTTASLSDHTTCGDDIDTDCTTGRYLVLVPNSSDNTSTVWEQEVLLYPSTDYKFFLQYVSVSAIDVSFELYVDGVRLNIPACLPSATPSGCMYPGIAAVTNMWRPFMHIINASDLSLTTVGTHTVTVKMLVDGSTSAKFAIDDISMTYCGTPGSYMCTLPPPSEDILINDDCIESAINNAVEGAQNEYDEYIAEQRGKFIEAYKRHCLDVYEELEMKYKDTEHHYTLYYYDQAGNLERTVPPNGVVLITDPDTLDQVAIDRESGMRSVFTNHSYATTYKYNSLNQLVSQSMPDHQDMNISGSTSLTGINPSHHVQSISFNGNTGLAVANDGTNGYIYTFDHLTNSWSLITGLSVYNLNDVLFIDPTTAYAVGDHGTVLYTSNTGSSWNLLPFPNVNKNLIRLHKDNTGTNVYVYDNKGSQYKSSSSGTSWSSTSSGITLGGSEIIMDIDVDKTSGYGWAVTSDNRFYTVDAYDGPTAVWTLVTGTTFNTVDLTAVASNGTDFYAFGLDGTVLKSASGLSDWEEIESRVTTATTNTTFSQVVFTSASDAYALDVTGKVYRTTDAAQTWLSTAVSGTVTVVQLQATSGRVYALASDGNLFYTTTGTSWTSVLSSPVANAKSLFMTSTSDGYIGTSTGDLYTITTTLSVTSAAPAYTSPTYTVNPLNGSSIDEIYFSSFAEGFIRTANSSLQNVYYIENPGPVSAPVLLGSPSDNYTHIYPSSAPAPTSIYAIDATGTVVSGTSSGFTGSTIISGASGLSAFTIASNNQTVVVGSGGHIYPFSGTSTGFNSLVSSVTIDLPALSSVSTLGATSAIAAGRDGTLIKTTGGTAWQAQATNTNTNLNDIANNGIYLAAAGDYSAATGAFNDVLYGTISPVSVSLVANPATQNIRKVYTDATNAYLMGDNYTVATVGLTSGTAATYTPGTGNLLGMDMNGGNLLVVGSVGTIYYGAVNALTAQNSFVPPVLNDITYLDASHAVAVGNAGNILVTSNAGVSWQSLYLNVGSAPGVTDNLNAVTASDATHAYAVGDNYALVEIVFSGGYTASALTGTSLSGNLNDIEASNGYFVAVNNMGKIFETDNVTSWSTQYTHPGPAVSLNSVSNKNGHFACVVGDGGLILTAERGFSSGSKFQPDWTASTNGVINWSTEDQHAVYFVDYATGYVTGDNGLVMKTINGGASWTVETYSTIPTGSINTIAAAPSGTSSTYVVAGNAGASASVADMKNEFSTRMYYDQLGRLVASQNSKQFAKNPLTYSYTIFDALGRIREVGEYLASASIELIPGLANGQINIANFGAWLGAGTSNKTEVTRTFYDEATSLTIPGFTQNGFNLRNRVSYSVFYDNLDRTGFTTDYEHASYFDYDIHGNVKKLVQHNPYMQGDNEFKFLEYNYDLISGKTNEVVYQKGYKDEFHHKYEYDADNRLTSAYTSSDGVMWDQDAKYFYYKHGPMARMEIGDQKVQGVDFAYTIQGWMKGVNSNSLEADNDIGTDGQFSISTNLNKNLAIDKFGYTLGYYNGDYIPKAASNTLTPSSFIASTAGTVNAANINLFNGNISNMATTITDVSGNALPLMSLYGYDQQQPWIMPTTKNFPMTLMVISRPCFGKTIQVLRWIT
jgi:photosystem II stability/assembly factor-like uncharacterized protein